MYLKVNDHIMFGEYSGQPVTVDGESYLIMRQPDVIGILDE
jgi:chaperonin GroES